MIALERGGIFVRLAHNRMRRQSESCMVSPSNHERTMLHECLRLAFLLAPARTLDRRRSIR
jgi:hypothetical protein